MFKESICQRHKMLNPKISAGEYHEAAIQIKRPKKIPKQVWPYNRDYYRFRKDIGRVIPLPIFPTSMILRKMKDHS